MPYVAVLLPRQEGPEAYTPPASTKIITRFSRIVSSAGARLVQTTDVQQYQTQSMYLSAQHAVASNFFGGAAAEQLVG